VGRHYCLLTQEETSLRKGWARNVEGTIFPFLAMRTVVRPVVVVLFILIGSLTAEESVVAEEADNQKAIEHYQAGQREFNLGRWDAAVAEFQKAHELRYDAIVLFNLAQTHDRKGDTKRAIDIYQNYLVDAPMSPLRAMVEERIATLQKQADLAEYVPSSATSSPAAPSPVPPPTRVPAAASPSVAAPPAAVSPAVAPEPEATAGAPTAPMPPQSGPSVPVPPEPAALPTTTDSAPLVPSSPNPAAGLAQVSAVQPVGNPGRGLRVAGVVCGATAIALVGAGVVFGLETRTYSNSVESDPAFNPARANRGLLYEQLQWTAYGLGAGMAAAGALLYWLGATPAHRRADVALVPLSGGAGVSAKGAF
jgi:tetratricopeptide (TPR) repeat protein